MDTLTCASCAFWQAQPGAYYGDCQMQVVYGRVAFDYQPCAYHSERGKTQEGIALQSSARGMTYVEWVKRVMAGQ